ncbi:MAG: lipopolysaccharide biosynthesis protein [Variibacter sp.]|nr:lipopolysaccharide biosynthesis protein [Variibacter sp.]
MASEAHLHESAPIATATAAAPASRQVVDGELDLGSIGRALWRRRMWLLVATGLVAALTFVTVNLITPRYKSETRIILEGRENVFLRPDAERGGDRDRSALDQEAITSQVQLALSREVAREVIKELKLNERPEFDPVLRGVGILRHLLILVGLARDPLRMTPEERVLETYFERLTAYQVEKSRVIAIEFQSSDPAFAARGADAVAEAYLRQLQIVRQEQTRAAGQWLAGEIETLRGRVAEAESNVERFRSRSNLFVGANNSSLSNQQLGELNSQIGVARAQKAELDARAQSIREMLRAGRPIESGDIINSELIRRLNEQRVTLRAQLAEQSSTLLDGHPRIKELRAQIADLERQIRVEAERIVRSLENDARIAGARVAQLTANLEQLKRQASSTNEQDVQLRALEREAKAQRDLLESYLAKYREATARETMGTAPADARIISRAVVSNTPYFPKKFPIILIATLGTLLLGVGFITTGELLAGNVYRAADFAEAAPAEGRLEPYPAAPPIAANDGTRAPSLGSVVSALKNAPAEHRRVAVFGLADEAATGAAALAVARALAPAQRDVLIDLAFAEPRAEEAHTRGMADVVRGEAALGEVLDRDRASRAHIISRGHIPRSHAATEPEAILASPKLAIALDAFERSYDRVILNLGALGMIPGGRIPALASVAVLVTPPEPTEEIAEAAVLAGEALRAAGYGEVLTLPQSALEAKEREGDLLAA